MGINNFKFNEEILDIKPEFKDERGIITNIMDETITHVAIITSKAGSVRGNHYHPKQMQYVYLISGGYNSYSIDINGKNPKLQSRIIIPRNLVVTPPMIAHAMKFTKDSVILNLTTGGRASKNFKSHTIKHHVID